MTNADRICIITPGHIASAPRVVKEADALAGAGFSVHVVSGRSFAPADVLDKQILAQAKWGCTRVQANGPGAFFRKLQSKIARRRVAKDADPSLGLASCAIHADTARLGGVASGINASLYIGHCIPGLAAAALAAGRRGRPYGFDAEDFHDAETFEAVNDPAVRNSVRAIESKLLPGCTHLTAASPLIGAEYAKVYGVNPVTVLNAFPRDHAPAAPVLVPPVSTDQPAIVYWFSQTIGPGRGLEEIISVLGKVQTPVELHLRGFTSPSYSEHLAKLGSQTPRPVKLRILDPGASAEMSRLASSAHIGLAIEPLEPLNRALCLTNKIFVYLMAGIPQLLSRTPAQSNLATELGEAAILADISDAETTARELDQFFADARRMASARKAAWDRAHERFCWEVEQGPLIASVRKALGAA